MDPRRAISDDQLENCLPGSFSVLQKAGLGTQENFQFFLDHPWLYSRPVYNKFWKQLPENIFPVGFFDQIKIWTAERVEDQFAAVLRLDKVLEFAAVLSHLGNLWLQENEKKARAGGHNYNYQP